jgi:hypothetical protein
MSGALKGGAHMLCTRRAVGGYSHSQLLLDKSRNPTKNRSFAHFAVKYHNAHKKYACPIFSVFIN